MRTRYKFRNGKSISVAYVKGEIRIDYDLKPNEEWRTNEDGNHYVINTNTGEIMCGMGGVFSNSAVNYTKDYIEIDGTKFQTEYKGMKFYRGDKALKFLEECRERYANGELDVLKELPIGTIIPFLETKLSNVKKIGKNKWRAKKFGDSNGKWQILTDDELVQVAKDYQVEKLTEWIRNDKYREAEAVDELVKYEDIKVDLNNQEDKAKLDRLIKEGYFKPELDSKASIPLFTEIPKAQDTQSELMNRRIEEQLSTGKLEVETKRVPIGTQVFINGKIYTRISDSRPLWQTEDGALRTLDLTQDTRFIKWGEWKLPEPPNVEQNKQVYSATKVKEVFPPIPSHIKKKADRQEYRRKQLGEWLEKHGGKKSFGNTLDTIQEFTENGFEKLRLYEKYGLSDSGYKEHWDYDEINSYIDQAPKFEGTLYRGTTMDIDTFKKLRIGDSFKMDGITSFSSDETIATGFAFGGGYLGNPSAFKSPYRARVVFKTNNGVHRGTDISFMSKMKHEREVLMHSSAEYTIKSVEPKTINGNTYFIVELDENY